MTRPVALLTGATGEMLGEAVRAAEPDDVVVNVAGARAAAARGDALIAFATSVIIPADVLSRFDGRAWNVHTASPEYPGRDPHHFAVFEGATRYGATLHRMAPSVDTGEILEVAWFDVPADAGPADLLAGSVAVGLPLLRRGADALRREVSIPPAGTEWSGRRRSRADFIAMCQIDPTIDREAFEARMRAFDGGENDNLYVVVHGWTFRIDKSRGRRTEA